MRRFFTFALGALAMVAVALISMFITMRFAIHGREAAVPQLTGLSVAEADAAADHVGLRLTVENRFYSSEVPAGRVLAQDPIPGSHVRHDWPVRITESLGAQRIEVPSLTGESERAALVSVRRLALEPGITAHLPVPGDADVVLAQTPTPNSAGVNSPRVSLLVSDPTTIQPQAWVMPQLVGLSLATAVNRTAAAGLHLEIAETAAPAPASTPAASAASPAGAPAPNPSATPVISPGSIVTAQTPPVGHRVQLGDVVHVSMQAAASPAAPVSHAN